MKPQDDEHKASLLSMVADEIAHRSAASVDDLLPMFPDFSRDQLQDALWGANRAGRIQTLTKGNKHRPGMWGPANNPRQASFRRERVVTKLGPRRVAVYPLIASVFDLGCPRDNWPAMQPGTRHNLLGSWESEEAA